MSMESERVVTTHEISNICHEGKYICAVHRGVI